MDKNFFLPFFVQLFLARMNKKRRKKNVCPFYVHFILNSLFVYFLTFFFGYLDEGITGNNWTMQRTREYFLYFLTLDDGEIG